MHPESQFSYSTIAYERALDELRRQMGIALFDGKNLLGSAYPVEFLEEAQWENMKAHSPQMLITPLRAKILGLVGGALDVRGLSLSALKQFADPALGKITYAEAPLAAPAFSASLLRLTKHAALLPALIFIPNHRMVEAEYAMDVNNLVGNSATEIIEGASASLPIDGAENANITSFRTRHSSSVHLALKIGNWKSEASPLVRVHSSCVTGDILGSLRCDCGDQLRMALAQMSEAGAGVLLYLHQEGRGIGISNKLRAYCLQEQGIDTYEANQMLGYEEDERDFAIAAAMLKKLGVANISLLTNNPAKISLLEGLGIKVSKRVPLIARENKHNHDYLAAKAKS